MRPRAAIAVVAAALGVIALVVLVLGRLGDSTGGENRTIVMLGDSITEGGDWASMFPGIAIVNEGHSGYTTGQLVPVATKVAARHPGTLIILVGTNDLRDDLPPTPASTVKDMSELLDIVATTTPETHVVLQTVLPRGDRVEEVRAINAELRRLATERGLTLLDTYVDFDDGSGALRADETSDGVHLTEAGYARWAELLRPIIDSAAG